MKGRTWGRAALATVLTLSMATGAASAARAVPAQAHHHLLGDFDGDGRFDLAVGTGNGDRVRVHYTRAHPHGSHVAFITGHAQHAGNTGFGWALAIGDFDGDGFSDLAVGAPLFQRPDQSGDPRPQGAVFEFDGSATGLHQRPLALTGPYDGHAPFNLGEALASRDLDGDGYSDVAASLPAGAAGYIRVYRGSAAGLTTTGRQQLDAYQPEALTFGDVDGDDHPDLVSSSTVDLTNPMGQDFGKVKIFYGRAHGHGLAEPAQTIRGDKLGVEQRLGNTVDSGDIDGDGYDDVVVGANRDRQRGTERFPGSIVVLYGGPKGLLAAHSERIAARQVYSPIHSGDEFGRAVCVKDVTGDGKADVVVGARGVKVTGHYRTGAVLFLRGSAHGLSLAHRQMFTPASPGVPGTAQVQAYFGSAVYLAPVAGDGHRDLIVSAPNASHGALHGGFVVVLRGTGSGLTAHHPGSFGDARAGDQLGQSIK